MGRILAVWHSGGLREFALAESRRRARGEIAALRLKAIRTAGRAREPQLMQAILQRGSLQAQTGSSTAGPSQNTIGVFKHGENLPNHFLERGLTRNSAVGAALSL